MNYEEVIAELQKFCDNEFSKQEFPAMNGTALGALALPIGIHENLIFVNSTLREKANELMSKYNGDKIESLKEDSELILIEYHNNYMRRVNG